MQEKLKQTIEQGYRFKGESIELGTAVFEGIPLPGTKVTAPLKTFNRHGLISGATGTGKTKTLQRLAESLSEKGVSVLVMDIKGDLSGISQAGTLNEKISERAAATGVTWNPEKYPVEFLTLSNEPGARLRATVTEFGPVLFSKVLELNDTQAGVVSLVFKYADDQALPLLDLKDFRKTLQFLTNEGKEEIKASYGSISQASTSTILRKLIEIEQQGAERFFGEVSFDVNDLVRMDDAGKGQISVIRLCDIQDKPKLFSTFMLALLAEIYSAYPEEGDLEQPKLCIFIDEAHLIFNDASKSLLDQVEMIVRLIRSKAVGVFFCTQTPMDIPNSILGQLGLKVQHALRAFTAADRKTIKATAENYPSSDIYKTDELLTQLGIGEAFVTVLGENGSPTPLVHTSMSIPRSRMGVISQSELDSILSKSKLVAKYNHEIDSQSAYEILQAKLNQAMQVQQETEAELPKKGQDQPKTMIETIASNPMARQVANTVVRELTRGLLGVLGLKSTGKRGKSWF
jgi:DNA helicase HerA-like ATPase